jgi:hypothetical protein
MILGSVFQPLPCMAEPEFLDLVTPPSSPDPPPDQCSDDELFREPSPTEQLADGGHDPEPPLEEQVSEDERDAELSPEKQGSDGEPEPDDSPVKQVSGGGPGRAVIPVAQGGPDRCEKIHQLRLGMLLFQADNWAPKLPKGSGEMPSFLDMDEWFPLVFNKTDTKGVDDSKYNIVHINGKSKKSWETIFKPPQGDFKVLSLLAHSAPLPSDLKKTGKNDPGQVMCYAKGKSMRFTEIAKYMNGATSKKKDKYDLVLLGCCQGDKFAPLIKNIVSKDGLIVFYGGKDEDVEDGVAAGNVVEVWEVILQNVKEMLDSGKPVDLKRIFEESFVEVGIDYLAPSGLEDELEPNGDFKYLRLVMNKSVKEAMKDPTFKQEFTYAGDIHAILNGEDLVTPELLRRREARFAEQQARIDAGLAQSKSKDRSGKRRRD